MKAKTAIAAGFLLILFSCTRPVVTRPPEPAGLIPKDSMTSILVDIHLAEAIMHYKEKNGEKASDYKYELYKSIFDKYSTSENDFENSFNYYQSDVEEMDAIYQEVLNRLSKLQSEPQDTSKTTSNQVG